MPAPAPTAILPVSDSNEDAEEVEDAHPERDRVVEATPRGVGKGARGRASDPEASGGASEKTRLENPIMAAVLQACDAGVIRSTRGSAPCRPSSQPWVIVAASLGSGMAFLDSTVMNVALPAVQVELGASAREVQWTYGAFALVLAALILVGGTLGDRFGWRRLFVLGATIFGAASLWCALASDPGQLVAARAVQGVGGALLVPASLAIVGASFEGKQRAKAIGAWGPSAASRWRWGRSWADGWSMRSPGGLRSRSPLRWPSWRSPSRCGMCQRAVTPRPTGSTSPARSSLRAGLRVWSTP